MTRTEPALFRIDPTGIFDEVATDHPLPANLGHPPLTYDRVLAVAIGE